MIKFRSFTVRSFSLEYFDLRWEIENTSEDVQDWQFYVERSETENGDWEEIAGPLVDQYYLRDNTVHTISHTRTWFYRIRARHAIQGWEVVTEIQDVMGPEDLVAAEIIRNEGVMFREHAGVACWVFNRRTFGQRCPNCYDPRLRKGTDRQCEVCWGTGFSGGYHRPVKFWGRIQESEVRTQILVEDARQPVFGTMDCNPSPEIRPMDLIVDARNNRYVAAAISGSTRLGVTVRQIVTLTKLEKSSVSYVVPLNVNTEVEELRAPRNFSNPHNFDNVRDVELEDVIQTWQRY